MARECKFYSAEPFWCNGYSLLCWTLRRQTSITDVLNTAVHWHSSSSNQTPTLLVSPLIRLIWQCDEFHRNGVNGCCDWARQPNEGILRRACPFLINPAPGIKGNWRRQGCCSEDWPVKKTQSVQLIGDGGEECVAGGERGWKSKMTSISLLTIKQNVLNTVLWLIIPYSW